MSIELKLRAEQAAEAIDWLLNIIRRDAPQLSGKAIGNAEKCASALRAALIQHPATTEPVKVAPYNPTEEMRWAMKRIDPALSSEQCRALWSAAWSASPSAHPAPSEPSTGEPANLAPSIYEDNARLLQAILDEMRETLWAPSDASIISVLRKHMRAAKVMHDALEYLSNLHPRRCNLAEVTRAREAIERYRGLFQSSTKEPT